MGQKTTSLQILVILWFVLSYSIFLVFDSQTVVWLCKEDHLIEWLGALFLLFGSLFFLMTYLKDRGGNDLLFFKTKKNIFFLLLSLISFFGFGEEISWGQRILHIQTPEVLKQVNKQKEFNVHNLNLFTELLDGHGDLKSVLLSLLTPARLFLLLCLIYFLLLPLLDKISPALSRFFTKTSLPIAPVMLGVLFFVNVIIQKLFDLFELEKGLHHYSIEVKETNGELIFLILSIYFFQIGQRKKGKNSIQSV
jgi:hypothetical protein